MSVIKVPEADSAGWSCANCNVELTMQHVELEYLDSLFNVELPACPQCGIVLIPETLALGKMNQVEHLLEDK
ncbi:DVU_1557 family redox protein [Pseudodesulfovibrio sp. zrk46]|uniref:DVU_1557 family redox protein n=1 Tax=Pseudodesulfovibrio sp. zrk46 TaxID=2725288 RepID=UPI00144A1A92|nr:CLJU_RS11820 family redox protein [Pseudodesulfovibrio sp. zrk46]QJB57419.1 DNA-binding protein [Pseudodesulfovibrio sp. zrk46]